VSEFHSELLAGFQLGIKAMIDACNLQIHDLERIESLQLLNGFTPPMFGSNLGNG